MEKKKGILASYWEMWKRGLDFSGLCSMRVYRGAMLLHVVLIALLAAAACFYPGEGEALLALLGYGTLSLLPVLSLSVRRFRDAGKSGWWTILVLVGVGVFFCLCFKQAAIPILEKLWDPVCLYGPPSNWDNTLA